MSANAQADIKQILSEAWLGLGDTSKLKIENPLVPSQKYSEQHGIMPLTLMKNPEYLGYACRVLLNISLLPVQTCILSEFWNKKFPMYIASRGFGKSFTLAIYSLLKLALTPPTSIGDAGCKVVIAGAGFRQSRIIFSYMESIWNNAPILRSVCGAKQGPRHAIDRSTFYIGANTAIAIPVGTGEKIRGLRSTNTLCDEFGALSPSIYEEVIQGFSSVKTDPAEGVRHEASKALANELNIGHLASQADMGFGNQTILSGTASYDFEHFADYWKKYKTIIYSRGDPDKLRSIFSEGIPLDFNWRHYSIIRFPYELIPRGFMDDDVVIRAKATTHSGVFAKEYATIFTKDSTGFFKRSLIESCVANDENMKSENWPKWCSSPFDIRHKGEGNKEYVIAMDPASEVDKCAIVVLELYEEHSRVVYCWTTNRREHKAKLKAHLTSEEDFYSYCARKVRELMQIFPTKRIGLDAQGGGIAIMEAFHDKDKVISGEHKIWPVVDDNKKADTDHEPGLHILEMCQFANYEWLSTANHGLKKDMEDKVILFPRFDPISLEHAIAQDKTRVSQFAMDNPGSTLNIYDTLEDCINEVEELKDELTTIVHTKAGTGVSSRDRWDTPEVKLRSGKKGRLRKDRYSALLMGNMLARQTRRQISIATYDAIGGIVESDPKRDPGTFGPGYSGGPEWFMNEAERLMNEL
jgi:hypothetical protein